MYLSEKIQILSRQKTKSQFNKSKENKYFRQKLTDKQIVVFQRELKFRGVSINIQEYKLTAQYTFWQVWSAVVSTVHCSGTRERLELCDCTTALLLCVAMVEGGRGYNRSLSLGLFMENIQSIGQVNNEQCSQYQNFIANFIPDLLFCFIVGQTFFTINLQKVSNQSFFIN